MGNNKDSNMEEKLEKVTLEKDKLYNRNVVLTESKQMLNDKIDEQNKLISKLTDLNDKYLDENSELSKNNRQLEDSNKLLYNNNKDLCDRNITLIKANEELLNENNKVKTRIKVQEKLINELKLNYLDIEEKLKQLSASESSFNISYYEEINKLFRTAVNQQYDNLESTYGLTNVNGFSNQERTELIEENNHLKKELNKMRSSNSWKLTEPLRGVGRKLRKR